MHSGPRVICWSCEKSIAAATGATCASCGAILPPDPTADHFAVLGLPCAYAVDMEVAEARFRELSRRLHPDRFATADPRARRASLERSVQLNQAWRTIRDPASRAEYVLHLAGYDIGAEEGASRPGQHAGAGPGRPREPTPGAAPRARLTVSPALLGEILELREDLADARAGGDHERVQVLSRDVHGRLQAAETRVAAALGDVPAERPAPSVAMEASARELIAIRYYRRFLDEVAAHEEAAAAAAQPGETSHA